VLWRSELCMVYGDEDSDRRRKAVGPVERELDQPLWSGRRRRPDRVLNVRSDWSSDLKGFLGCERTRVRFLEGSSLFNLEKRAPITCSFSDVQNVPAKRTFGTSKYNKSNIHLGRPAFNLWSSLKRPMDIPVLEGNPVKQNTSRNRHLSNR
jgi:hypothetical protein